MVYGLKSYLACFFAYMVVRFDLLMSPPCSGRRRRVILHRRSMADLVYMLPSVIGTLLFPGWCARDAGGEMAADRRRRAAVLVVMVGVSSVSPPGAADHPAAVRPISCRRPRRSWCWRSHDLLRREQHRLELPGSMSFPVLRRRLDRAAG